jgi:hypothetical protein
MNALFRPLAISIAIGSLSMCAWAQRYVISAKPGAINYIAGSTFLDGRPILQKQVGKSFLSPNDVVSTDIGKAEILLTPGVFLRIGSNTAVQMVSLSLTDIQARVMRGEAMLEVDELTKDNQLGIFAGTGSARIERPGLYRFTGDSQPSVAVISGKAQVSYANQNVRLHKGHEVVFAQTLEKRKFNAKKEDDLYAWSNSRSEYNAAASYQTARNAWQNVGVPSGWGGYLGWGGYGLSSFNNPGWAWNPMFSSWAWLPGADMAFFSPFGYGFFAPAVVGYAPLSYAYTNGQRWVGPWRGGARNWAPIAVNPAHPPATGAVPRSAWQERAASARAARVFSSGFRTASGAYVPLGARMTGASSAPRFGSRTAASPRWAGNGGRAGGWSRPAGNGGRVGGWSRPTGSGGGHWAGSGGGRPGGGGGFSGARASGGGMSRGASAGMGARGNAHK